jgi:hypothetical protein
VMGAAKKKEGYAKGEASLRPEIRIPGHDI